MRSARPWLKVRALGVSLLAAAIFAGGCGGGGPATFDVAGSVTFKGQPVPDGEIRLDPDAGKNFDGQQGYARIQNGQFDTAKGGRGVAAGPYVIRILACDGKPGTEMPLGRPLRSEYEFQEDLSPDHARLTIDVPPR